MNFLIIALLRAFVFFMWNVQQLIDCLRGKRGVFIPITDLRIVYNSNGLIVIDKSHELLINSYHPWKNYVTLQMQLFFAFPHLADFSLEHMFRFVNRLDAPTSGLICLAYTPKAACLAARAFQNRTVKKCYLAVVWGHVQDATSLDPKRMPTLKYLPALTVDPSCCDDMCVKVGPMEYVVELALGDLVLTWPEGRKQAIMVPGYVQDCRHPRGARTKMTVLKHGFLEGQPASMLLLQPLSGRRHQLRLHCAVGLRGHPIAGDLLYGRLLGGDGDGSAEASRDHAVPRLMLHAFSLHLELVPKPPRVQGEKKQERVNRSHPDPVQLHLQSSRNMLEGCHWVDAKVFHAL